MAATLLEAVGILKSFGEVRALDHVSLAVRAGEVHALVGGNGAGKSTLVKVLAGVHRADRGELRIDGRPIRLANPLDARKAGISAVHQEINLVPMMSIARNLFLGREPRRFGLIDFSRMNDAAAQVLAPYGLRVDVRRPLGSLGPGARQMVAIARAAAGGARVILLDEPGAGLEPAEMETLFQVVDRLRDEGRAIVYVSHRLEELYRAADRVTVLRDGRVVRTGPLAEIDQVRLVSLMLGRPYRPGRVPPVRSALAELDFDELDLAEFGVTESGGGEPGLKNGLIESGAPGYGEPAHGPRAASEPAAVGSGSTLDPVGTVGPVGTVDSGRDESAFAASGESADSGDFADLPVLRATGLTRRRVLSGVSIVLRPGEVVGLGGLLGAGRSETARAIAGALPVDAGQVTVDGTPPRKWSIRAAIRAGISLVPENRRTEGIVPTLSVRDNIALAALTRLSRAGIVSEARVDKVVSDLMARLHIKATSPRQRVAELSGGNQQKVLLARWLAMHPRILLLDEPTRGVDVAAKAEMRSLIDDLAVDGLAVLLISSDPSELADNCDRVVVLRDGAVVGELTGLDITEQGIVQTIAEAAPAGAAGTG
ncbi:sugar ABC transporter ATP-binding protein [Thermopolyspora sp. NPDC052614]|uniref:sugar ABC transporter ATP-binding protein n=1 Tax=Thermopolyspora sp. NPDC052614 TaxID=3155682 RepID=UPI003441F4BB